MDFFNAGVSVGRYFGITVRLHFTFFIFAFLTVQQYRSLMYGLAFVAGLYLCILLHEFGHALAARWCDGEAENILLWPLGGLAFVRPAFHPTAHLITTVAGPFVTLVLWLLFWGLVEGLINMGELVTHIPRGVLRFVYDMASLNRWLLLFNLLPAFPMDGGRILRDTLWHWMSAETATKIAVAVSRVIAVGALAWALIDYTGVMPFAPLPISPVMTMVLALFILGQSAHEQQIVGAEAMGTYDFSLRERLHRGSRKRVFRKGVAQRRATEQTVAFHTCAVCQRTNNDAPEMDFRVCSDCTSGQEYCPEHLEHHAHT